MIHICLHMRHNLIKTPFKKLYWKIYIVSTLIYTCKWSKKNSTLHELRSLEDNFFLQTTEIRVGIKQMLHLMSYDHICLSFLNQFFFDIWLLLIITTSMGLEVEGNYELCWGYVVKCSTDIFISILCRFSCENIKDKTDNRLGHLLRKTHTHKTFFHEIQLQKLPLLEK